MKERQKRPNYENSYYPGYGYLEVLEEVLL